MSLRTIILLKNREAMIKKVNRKHTHIKNEKALYVMSESDINNTEIKRKIKGSEIIFFEDNPNAINTGQSGDQSSVYLNEIVVANALYQTSGAPSFDIGDISEKLAFLKSPMNWIYILFILALIYGIVFGGMGWT